MNNKKKCKDCQYLCQGYEHHSHNGIYWLECELSGKTLYNDYKDKKDFNGKCIYCKKDITKLLNKKIKRDKEELKYRDIMIKEG
jgi:hypothetical protein